jgi:hypothetical protein
MMKPILSFALFLLELLSTSGLAVGAQNTPPINPAEYDEFTVRVQLVDTKGKPVAGEPVYCFVFKAGVAYTQLGIVNEQIVPVNPKGTTDSRGQAKIKVDAAFIRKHLELTREYTIGVIRNRKPVPIRVNDVPVAFDLDLVRKAKNTVDLGKVTLDLGR